MKWTRNEGGICSSCSHGCFCTRLGDVASTRRQIEHADCRQRRLRRQCCTARRRSGGRQPRDDIANRATRAGMSVQLGELSSARQALEQQLPRARVRSVDLAEMDPRAIVTSIDGVTAFDPISGGAMMTGFRGGSAALPFVRMFYGAPSEVPLGDSCGTAHRFQQVANKVTPSCHCSTLSDSTAHWRKPVRCCCLENIYLFAFHDDIHMQTMPERVGAVHAIFEEQFGCADQNPQKERRKSAIVVERRPRFAT